MTRRRRTYTPDQAHRSETSAGPKEPRGRRTNASSASASAGIDCGSRSHSSTFVNVISRPWLGPKHTSPPLTARLTKFHHLLGPLVWRPHPPPKPTLLF